MATIQGAFLDDDLDAIYSTPSDDTAFGSDGIFNVLSKYDENPLTSDFDSPEAIGANPVKGLNTQYSYTNGANEFVLVNKIVSNSFTLADNFDDAALTKAAGAISLIGNAGNNFLGGNDFANTINGGAGNDSILAGAGIDTINYDVTQGNDSIIGGTGQDIVNLSGAAVIGLTFTSAEVGNGLVTDSDNLANQDGGLAVHIDAGTTHGRSDDEGVTFKAADGTKLSVTDLVSGVSRGNQFTQVVLGTTANDVFSFSATIATNEYINGGTGNDTIVAGAGDDFLVGGLGNDSLVGGSGNDSFIGGAGNDTINGGIGDDVVTGATTTDGDDNINVGTPAVGVGQSDNDYVDAGGGNNTIFTGVGNDTVFAGAGNDKITTGEGNKTINAGDGNNTVTTGAGNNHITTGSGNDTITTGAGNQTINAGDGNNKVTTGAGNDDITTGGGRDVINSGAGDDNIDAGSNHDSIVAGAGNDTVFGGDGRDTIVGGIGNDELHGDAGNDTIIGGLGNDTIFGGTGNDLLTGGAGDDVFIIGTNDAGIDVITDFSRPVATTDGDTLEIQGHDGGNGDFSFNDFEAASFPDPSIKGVFISFNDGGSVLLKNVALGDLFFDDATDTFSIVKGHGNVPDADAS